MKKCINLIPLLIAMFFLTVQINARAESGVDSTGLPGDNFSLHGALHLFQNSTSPEDFEKQLNTESNHVNNLDLNGDGKIDYIRVIDKVKRDAHALILQVPINSKESQDIAVIELEKTGDTTAVLQIIGDEDIYGHQVIVEPGAEVKDDKGNKGGSIEKATDVALVVVNVWTWPSVRYIYVPAYNPWVSPYYYGYYPVWWAPWRPVPYTVYYPYRYPYYNSYVVVNTHRVTRAHRIYTPVRRSSVTVTTRHATALGNYRVSKSTTVVRGPAGRTTQVKRTTVNTPRGSATRTQVRRRK